MDAARIERRLRLPLTNLCMAVLSAKDQEGALRECKAAVIREVERIVHDATRPNSSEDRTK